VSCNLGTPPLLKRVVITYIYIHKFILNGGYSATKTWTLSRKGLTMCASGGCPPGGCGRAQSDSWIWLSARWKQLQFVLRGTHHVWILMNLDVYVLWIIIVYYITVYRSKHSKLRASQNQFAGFPTTACFGVWFCLVVWSGLFWIIYPFRIIWDFPNAPVVLKLICLSQR
jgi:hypothetical protein